MILSTVLIADVCYSEFFPRCQGGFVFVPSVANLVRSQSSNYHQGGGQQARTDSTF